MSKSEWKDYFEKTKNRPPRTLLVRAVELVRSRQNALDLGSGALNDASHLLSIGFEKVVALDSKPVAAEIAEQLPKDRFSYVIRAFDEYDYPADTFDLINAQYALPFNKAETFDAVIRGIQRALKSGGIFAGQLFGDRDGWNKDDGRMTFHTAARARDTFKGMDIVSFEEEEKDGMTAAGNMKHWHVFHVIARKP